MKLFSFIMMLFLLISCEIKLDLSSTISSENYEKDLKVLKSEHPDRFSICPIQTYIEYFEHHLYEIKDMTYDEGLDFLEDKLIWGSKLENFRKVATHFATYCDRKELYFILEDGNGRIDFGATLSRMTKESILSVGAPSAPEPEWICNVYYNKLMYVLTNDGAWVLGFTTDYSAEYHKDKILQYEENNRYVLTSDIFCGDENYYLGKETIKAGIEIGDYNREELKDWYEVMRYFYERFRNDEGYKIKRNRNLKSYQLTGMQPQLWEN